MVPTNTGELPMIQFLNTPELRADKRNKMVEIIDMVLLPDTDEYTLVVMPKLMLFVVIPFQFVGEVCSAFLEFLEVCINQRRIRDKLILYLPSRDCPCFMSTGLRTGSCFGA